MPLSGRELLVVNRKPKSQLALEECHCSSDIRLRQAIIHQAKVANDITDGAPIRRAIDDSEVSFSRSR